MSFILNSGYSFTETSIGVFTLKNTSATKELKYVLSSDNYCGSTKLIAEGRLVETSTQAKKDKTFIVFLNLPEGIYNLKLETVGIPSYPIIKIKNFPRLETAILEEVEDLFTYCTNCKEGLNIPCLLVKMNQFAILNDIALIGTLPEKFKCTLINNLACTLNNQMKNNKGCDEDLKILIAFYYLVIYEQRIVSDKREKYNYEEIYDYIVANIINIR